MDAPNLLTMEGREGVVQAQPPSPPLATEESGLLDEREGNADRDKFDQSPIAGTSSTAQGVKVSLFSKTARTCSAGNNHCRRKSPVLVSVTAELTTLLYHMIRVFVLEAETYTSFPYFERYSNILLPILLYPTGIIT